MSLWPFDTADPYRTCEQIAIDRINGLVVADADSTVDCVAYATTVGGVTHVKSRTTNYQMTAFATLRRWPRRLHEIRQPEPEYPPPWWAPYQAYTKVH